MRRAISLSMCLMITLLGPHSATGQPRGVGMTIEAALLPLPPALRNGASVVSDRGNGAFIELRGGDNGLVCEAPAVLATGLTIACYQVSMLPLRTRRLALLAEGHTPDEVAEMLGAEVRSGSLSAPAAAVAYLLRGPKDCLRVDSTELCTDASLVYMVHTPLKTSADLGLPAERTSHVPYMHAEGSVWAHIMVHPPGDAVHAR